MTKEMPLPSPLSPGSVVVSLKGHDRGRLYLVLAQKGDTQCVLAANEKSLPYDKKRCDEVWMFIPKCKVIE